MLLTVGHGRLGEDGLGALLSGAGVQLLVDVRRFPGSHANPAVGRETLPAWLPGRDIDYRWEEQLGGRRRLAPDAADAWWQVTAFRAYAGHTRTEEFRAAMAGVVADARRSTVAVMCSESVWWRCHRRLIADVAVMAHGLSTRHLMHDGRLVEHPPAVGARLGSDGLVVWDAASGPAPHGPSLPPGPGEETRGTAGKGRAQDVDSATWLD